MRTPARTLAALLACVLLALAAGCGGDDQEGAEATPTPENTGGEQASGCTPAVPPGDRPAGTAVRPAGSGIPFGGEKQQSAGESPLRILPPSQPLIEPLSQRELEVLQLVAEGLSNREISERLFLALDTVKGHNRKIFDKLQVQRRTEAVAKASSLNLLPPQ